MLFGMRRLPVLTALCALSLLACEAEDPASTPDAAVETDGGGQGGEGGGQGGEGGGQGGEGGGQGGEGGGQGGEGGTGGDGEGPDCSLPDACGAPPSGAPCPDGTGPDITCEETPDATCEWSVRCPEPSACGGAAAVRCPENFYCDYDDDAASCGDADAVGICTLRPDGCPEHEDPVCGCDGHTYSNRCFAHMAGVDVLGGGACPQPVDCDAPDACGPPPPPVVPECPDGTFGEFICAPDAIGQCVWTEHCPAADLCQLPAEPGDCDAAIPRWFFDAASGRCEAFVYGGCGGNDNNFESHAACEARCGDAEPVACGAWAGNTCAEDEFCDFEALGCDWADAQGVCRPRPDPACIEIYSPVCGCDGNTYDNECFAQAAGTDAASLGPCDGDPEPQACGGRGHGPCPVGTFCNFPPQAICGAADGPGVCAPIPEACDAVFDPVCGCDDRQYGNACEAAAAQVSVRVDGPCEGPGPMDCGGFAGLVCPDGFFCDFPDGCGFADGLGACVPSPQACPGVIDPVCGCDGNTYDNDCVAASAGTDVQYAGACRDLRICGLPADSGPCEAAIPRWFHNIDTGRCEQFVYGGCGGNANNYETREACQAACER